MADLALFDANAAGNPNNNIFGLPFTEEEASVVILPVPWEVTVSGSASTARAPDHIYKSSRQIDIFDIDNPEGWKKGFYMRPADRKILLKSDYLRKEAELYIDYISKGEVVTNNTFIAKSIRDINEGSLFLNNWVYEQTHSLLGKGKLVALLGGDHSTPLGYLKALAEKEGSFGILQIDAHCNLRKAYEKFLYSHASLMYNALLEIPQLSKIVQVGVRDLAMEEWDYIHQHTDKVITYFDKDIKEQCFEGKTWLQFADQIINDLPDKVYLSFDIDGLDPKLCPNSGTPVSGGLEIDQVLYLVKKIIRSGRRLIGFDLCEVGVDEKEWDSNVGARILWKLCNLLVLSKDQTP